ncbi:MAG: sigma-70 family RNA polymerase sigma factor [Acidobacteria bacterium]|nr:sigma-70 family RNA polymerase sigma factor [Acidobacteriota bacterium]
MQTLHTPTAVRANSRLQQPDAVLIQQCLENDGQAWASLMERYGSLIYSIPWRLRLSSEDIAQVFQTVCLAMIERLGMLKDESNLSSWLTTMTLQQCLQIMQQQGQLVANQVRGGSATKPDVAGLSDEAIRMLEQERLVRQAISMIEEPCRSLLIHALYEKESWSCDQVAKELRQPTAATSVDLGCCLKKLMEVLDELGF